MKIKKKVGAIRISDASPSAASPTADNSAAIGRASRGEGYYYYQYV